MYLPWGSSTEDIHCPNCAALYPKTWAKGRTGSLICRACGVKFRFEKNVITEYTTSISGENSIIVQLKNLLQEARGTNRILAGELGRLRGILQGATRRGAVTQKMKDKFLVFDTPLATLKLSTREINAVHRCGIQTIGDLLLRSESDLQKVRGIGRKSIEGLKRALYALGLTLKPEPMIVEELGHDRNY